MSLRLFILFFLVLFFQMLHAETIDIGTTINSETFSVQSYLINREKLNSPSNSKTELISSQEVSTESCKNCPTYLSLTFAINGIVEKVKINETKADNSKMINLNRLKSFYYINKASHQESLINCSRNIENFYEKESHKASELALIAQKALLSPGARDFQYYPKSGKEAHYFFNENKNLIEVVISENSPTLIRQYKRDMGIDLPDLGGSESAIIRDKNHSFDLLPEINKSENLPNEDLKLGRGSLSYDLGHKTLISEFEASFNQRKGSVGLQSESGEQFLLIQAVNANEGNEVKTVVNREIVIPNSQGVKLKTSVGTKLQSSSANEKSSELSHSLNLSLTGHDSEYFRVTGELDKDGLKTIGVGNNVRVGEGKLGIDYQADHQSNSQASIKYSHEGILNEVGVKYQNNSNGENIESAYVRTATNQNTQLRLESSYSNIKQGSISLNAEEKISEEESAVVTMANNEQDGFSLLFQYSVKL